MITPRIEREQGSALWLFGMGLLNWSLAFRFIIFIIFIFFCVYYSEYDKGLLECKAQYVVFALSVQRNLRDLGILILELLSHSSYESRESDIMDELLNNEISQAELVAQYPFLLKYHPCISKLLGQCFTAPKLVSRLLDLDSIFFFFL